MLRAVRLRVFRPSIRSFADVYSLSSGVSAIFARIGFRVDVHTAREDGRVVDQCLAFEPASQKRPLQRSSAFA